MDQERQGILRDSTEYPEEKNYENAPLEVSRALIMNKKHKYNYATD
jgi:hypothetical protein